MLHGIRTGRIDPERPSWKFTAAPNPRMTPNPQSFDEAFRQIGKRKNGGGPKVTEHDAMLFVGNLGRGMLILTSRVRLIDPNESFYTTAGHRLRDSRIGEAGHWIDIQVRGACPDEDLDLIRRLAQDIDNRPVVVRRGGRAEREESLDEPSGTPAPNRTFAVGDRVRVSPDFFDKRWTGRTGTVARLSYMPDWISVDLDPRPREPVRTRKGFETGSLAHHQDAEP
jgi:hypothetical protein